MIPLTRKDPVRREQIEEMLMTKQNHKELRVPGTVCLCPSTVAVTDMPKEMAKENAGRVEEEVMTETEVLPLTTLDAEKDVQTLLHSSVVVVLSLDKFPVVKYPKPWRNPLSLTVMTDTVTLRAHRAHRRGT
jgi:hypothetical protein